MYGTVLLVHSLLRYAILILVLVILYRAVTGMRRGGPFDIFDRKLSMAYMATVHTHVLLGILLFAVMSPITQAAFAQMGLAMKDKLLRFWTVEHTFMGLLVAVLVTVAHVRTKRIAARAGDDAGPKAYKHMLVMNLIAFVVMLAMIPWPFRKVIGRAMLPL